MTVRYWIAVALATILGLVTLAGAGTRSNAAARRSGSHDHSGQAAHGDDESSDVPTPCMKTAKLARKACKDDVRDNYFTQLGSCLNLGDSAEAADCQTEARDIWIEDSDLCGERFGARLDVCDRLDEERYDPEIDPEAFLSPEETAADPNPFFPLVPGNTWVFESEEEMITVTVTDVAREILGVACIEVRDTVVRRGSGEPIEDTLDWYAQDVDGNLWYFGEIAQNFEDGVVRNLDGSWIAGEDYAKPGIVFPAGPFAGQAYRQEFLLREAEDVAEVLSVAADESVEVADCAGNCLQTLEYTPLEPGVFAQKFYVPGLGPILEVENGDRTELVSFTTD